MANWVIPGRLLAGGFLALTDPEATAVVWSALLGELGVTTIVCLNTDDELQHLEDYSARAREAGVRVVRLPIRDGGTADDDELVRLVQLVARCLRGEGDDAVYVHCLAGRGRTGVVCAVVLGALYGLSADARARAHPEVPRFSHLAVRQGRAQPGPYAARASRRGGEAPGTPRRPRAPPE